MDTGNDAHSHEHRDDRGAAVTDEGECQTDNGEKTDTHTYIDDDLKQQHAGDADTNDAVHIITGLHTYINAAHDDRRQKEQNDDATQHTEFLCDRRENEVCVLRGHCIGFDHRSVVKALSGDTAVLDVPQGEISLPAHILTRGVDRGVEEHHDTVVLIFWKHRDDDRRDDRDRGDTG